MIFTVETYRAGARDASEMRSEHRAALPPPFALPNLSVTILSDRRHDMM